jgi:hypothetical protein
LLLVDETVYSGAMGQQSRNFGHEKWERVRRRFLAVLRMEIDSFRRQTAKVGWLACRTSFRCHIRNPYVTGCSIGQSELRKILADWQRMELRYCN